MITNPSNINEQLSNFAEHVGTTLNTKINLKANIEHVHSFNDLTDKPDTLTGYGVTMDIVPTDNSTKPITSGGVKTAIDSIDALPNQTNNSGKYLTTNGTEASWSPVTSVTITYWE